jgi:hypothetical protein
MDAKRLKARVWLSRAAAGALLVLLAFLLLTKNPSEPPETGDARRSSATNFEKSEQSDSARSSSRNLKAKRSASEESSKRTPPVTGVSDATAWKCLKDKLLISRENVPVFLEPSENASRARFASGELQILDQRNDIEITDVREGWVRVRIKSPLWLNDPESPGGWIQRKNLRMVETADETACLFVDPKKWGNVSRKRAMAMRTTALRLLKEDRRCNRIFSGGFIGAGQRYYFDCYPNDGGQVYAYWFSLLTEERSFGKQTGVDESSAISSCSHALELYSRRVGQNHSNTIDATPKPLILDYTITQTEGVWQIVIKYTDDASTNRQIHCLVDQRGRPGIIP